ncbi:pentatricopeptide repeat-containing protein At3g60050 isoform X1 [Cryptomeria japonica]|uniref:pentatricopeptide repeat-containing protein At3g60050 isoform X1 n=1 Tax=Cryptomeria japonica TaxID=3369 RepID=UPI0025AC23A5|nr:pentatricopeptide repeat-containing protein At3g60050 isoform X1 [Cryptomeria japonica]XP_057815893.1 pentatricopeptide repeat-containing protein At3g60050 isoform X1 [Cryptomeria japonica]XP_057815894.1 pentatricopeptide repeat-containing protein At3g60050 isoform X1 [Cryptomeria japonica]XP_057815895.1 pentatricopeptide repeat-containing protein At3g60050 isoform X1 [Cryptomeria japonica]
MYLSSSISRYVRYVPMVNIIFYCSKSGKGFNNNEKASHKKNLEQSDQEKIAKDGNFGPNGTREEPKFMESKLNDFEKPGGDLGFKECSVLNGNPREFSGFIKGVYGSVEVKNDSGFNEHSEVFEGKLGFKRSSEDSEDKLGFEESSNNCRGNEEKSWIEDNSDASQGSKFRSRFQNSPDEHQGLNGNVSFAKFSNRNQRYKENLGCNGNSNVCQGSEATPEFQVSSKGSREFEDKLESQEISNGSRGIKDDHNIFQGYEENVDGFSWFEENPGFFTGPEGEEREDSEERNINGSNGSSSSRFYSKLDYDANLLYEILQREELGFDVKEALQKTGLRMTIPLVRRVLMKISKSINNVTKFKSAKLGFKFFLWAGQQDRYRHNSETHNLLVKIFADCDEFKAMWRLVDEMIVSGCPITARTFNILLSSSRQAGMPKRVVDTFIRSKQFNFRPYKHSFNAILHALLREKHFNLIEWVYEEMLNDGHQPDILTYNILIYAKYRLGKVYDVNQLLAEMGENGFAPDFYTYNILLHVLGKGDKPRAALDLLNYMIGVGCHPGVTHFTALIDGLGRAGNLDACKYFFEEMIKKGRQPDVVCYTVMITSYVVGGELEKAQTLFDEMIHKGQLPNEYTYNAMILGLCNAERYEEACGTLGIMESRDCYPDFIVYRTLVRKLRNARKYSEARKILKEMEENGCYAHLVAKLQRYRR